MAPSPPPPAEVAPPLPSAASPSRPSIPHSAALKARLLDEVPPGGEAAAAAAAAAAVAAAAAALDAIRGRRAELARRLGVRARKLADWKGKFPRDPAAASGGDRADDTAAVAAPDADARLAALPPELRELAMPLTVVATLTPREEGADNSGGDGNADGSLPAAATVRAVLAFTGSRMASATEGVEGFSHLWLVSVAAIGRVGGSGDGSDTDDGNGGGGGDPPAAVLPADAVLPPVSRVEVAYPTAPPLGTVRLHLTLVALVRRVGAAAVEVAVRREDVWWGHGGAPPPVRSIVDVKPYLRYCESWPGEGDMGVPSGGRGMEWD
ncbi:hypothetical protein MMPV_001813 [Pyropia vietnamensis]